MPAIYCIDIPNHCVHVTAKGPLDKQQVLDIFCCFLDDPGFEPGMDLLADLRAAEIRSGLEAITEIIDHVKQHRARRGTNYRVALVVAHGFQETMAQLYRIYSKSLPMTPVVFHSVGDAREWLGHVPMSEPPAIQHLSSPF